ncbi:MAG TPA: VOC family protein [Rhizomicrobium sp.]|jgi:catechol 2,3-dioxygenase-like lactoylglutathione lyase family enzyme
MLHHVSVGVDDVAKAAEFYDAILSALGYKRTAQYLPYAIAYGEGISEFWIQLPHDRSKSSPGNGMHVAFAGRSRDAVNRFHEASLAHGGTDEGGPGPRPDYGPDYYGAFVRDPFGNKVEAVLRPATRKRTARRASRTASRGTSKAKGATGTRNRRAGAKAARRKAKRR